MSFLNYFRRSDRQIPSQWLIAGLGNPGKRYATTRHNVGFMLLDRLANIKGFKFDEYRFKSIYARCLISSKSVILLKPQTFMNLSGEAIVPVARYYKIPTFNILVLLDDLDLPIGAIRLRPDGGSAGHKGMQSIIRALGTNQFPRLRIGIDRPPGSMDPMDYVLQPFNAEQIPIIDAALNKAVEAVEVVLDVGITTAMNIFNHRVVDQS